MISRPFLLRGKRACVWIWTTWLAAILFLGDRDVLCEFDYWPLAVSMPPTKVCPQCKAAVPVRQKTCERCDLVFRSKRKAECSLQEKAKKRMRAVEPDSARKAKDKLHKACERTLHRQKRNRMRITSMRKSRDSHALLRQGFGTSVPFICLVVVLITKSRKD